MAYEGELLDQCSIMTLDYSRAMMVAVSGDGPNVCGHMIVGFSGKSGFTYFHVAQVYGRPRYMSEDGFKRYLSETGKQQLGVSFINLPDAEGAQSYLCKLMGKKWAWGVIPNNCVAFIEEILAAGGAQWSSVSNCPAVAIKPPVTVQINNLLNDLNRSIYRYYGLPY